MIAFQPTGPILSFTGASSAPTSVQPLSTNGVRNQQFCLTNTDSTNDCVVGWGQTDAEAKLNAAVATASQKCYYLLARSQVIVTAGPEAFFSGIAVASTSVIKVQCGYGS
jgi:hypothetical protein